MNHLFRRTCRKLIKENYIDKKLIDSLLESANNALLNWVNPSLTFYVINNSNSIASLSNECQNTIFNLNPNLYSERMKSMNIKSVLTYDCPCCIIITCPKSKYTDDIPYQVGFVAQNILVKADSLDLAAIPVGVVKVVSEKWLNYLHSNHPIQEEEELLLMIVIGHPDKEFKSKIEPKILKSEVIYH